MTGRRGGTRVGSSADARTLDLSPYPAVRSDAAMMRLREGAAGVAAAREGSEEPDDRDAYRQATHADGLYAEAVADVVRWWTGLPPSPALARLIDEVHRAPHPGSYRGPGHSAPPNGGNQS